MPLNHWTQLSIELATQRDYLDQLYRIYPMAPDAVRELPQGGWAQVECAFEGRDNATLLRALLQLPLFPIKDSYQRFFKHDPRAIERNPRTVARLMGRVRELGLNEVRRRCEEPKETNRQIGPLFRQWIKAGGSGLNPVPIEEFAGSSDDAVVDDSEHRQTEYARRDLGYTGYKDIDFVARCNGKVVIGEAKFVTDFGGHQDRQLDDALALAETRTRRFVPVAVLDGVIFLPRRNKIGRRLEGNPAANVLSALLLRDFLFSL